jgi:hypothetical protein
MPDIPGGGVVTVTKTAVVSGSTVPSEVTMTSGATTGSGTDCSTNAVQFAFDLTGTRQP